MSDTYSVIGQSVPRKDALGKVMGNSKYINDLKADNMLYGAVLLSPLPHARIKNIDTSRAKAMPGVVKVLTAKDIPGINLLQTVTMDQELLMTDRVLRIGDPVALVAAETEDMAREALDKIKVDYEELEPLFSIERALEKGAPILHGESNIMMRKAIERGNIEEGFAKSDVIVESSYTTPRLAHMYLEPEGALASYENGIMTVQCSIQYAHLARTQIARTLNMPFSKVRVILPTIGGGFGGKQDYTLVCNTALLAYYTHRPVKILRTRRESTLVSTKRHPFYIKARTGATKDGKLMATEVSMYADTGPYGDAGPAVATRSCMHFTGPYDIPNIKGESVLIYTNNPLSGSFRGFGAPQAAVCYEGQMNELARRLKIDPFEFRLMNVQKVGSYTATLQQLTNGVGITETINQARSKAKEVMSF